MNRIKKTILLIAVMTMFMGILNTRQIYAEHHEGYTGTDTLPAVQGSYYLTADVSISETWIVPEGIVNLCLNGHDITFTGATGGDSQGSVIKINSGSTMNLDDCGNGKITGGKGVNQSGMLLGAGIHVNGGTLNMYSGTISGNGADTSQLSYGAGVNVDLSGVFNMYGGTISGNIIGDGAGAGVCVQNRNGGNSSTFNMYGGTITDNTAANNAGGVGILACGVFNLHGGSITNNKVTNDQETTGGIYVGQADTFTVYGEDKIIVSGNTVNHGNRTSNVFLVSQARINVASNLNSATRIGVRMTSPRFFTSGFEDRASVSNFTSDDPNYRVTSAVDTEYNNKKEARLISHIHDFSYSSDGPTITAECDVADCTLPDGKIAITLNIDDYDYDGTAHAVEIDNLSDFNSETGLSLSSDDIKYYSGTQLLEKAPKDQGTYRAELTVPSTSITAVKTYTISSKEVTLNWKNTSFEYDGNKHVPDAEAGVLINDDKCSVTVTGEQSEVGTHTAEAIGLSNSNYRLPEKTSVQFTISKKADSEPQPSDKPSDSSGSKKSAKTSTAVYVVPQTGIE